MNMSTSPSGQQGPSGTLRPIAWMDGRVVPASEATVPLTDAGFLRGDGVFDAVLVRGGRTHALDEHLERLRRSGRRLGIRVPVVRHVVTDLLAAWGPNDGAIRVFVTRDGTVRGLAEQPVWPASLALATIDTPWRSALTGVKTLSYAANQWALRQAKERDADDALIVDGQLLLELPTGALCLVRAGQVISPDPASLPILDSITLRQLADVTDIEFQTPTVGDLAEIDEIFVVSATRPVLPVHAVVTDEHTYDFPASGAVTARLQDAFDDHIAATLDVTAST